MHVSSVFHMTVLSCGLMSWVWVGGGAHRRSLLCASEAVLNSPGVHGWLPNSHKGRMVAQVKYAQVSGSVVCMLLTSDVAFTISTFCGGHKRVFWNNADKFAYTALPSPPTLSVWSSPCDRSGPSSAATSASWWPQACR